MMAKIIENLKEKTGKNLSDWIDLLKEAGPKTIKEQRQWLKKEFGLGGTTVTLITDYAAGNNVLENYDPEAMVEAQYSGKKAVLRPIYEKLLELGFALGNDVKACPGKTIVPLYRHHVFAEIRPTTNTRIDLGLSLAKAHDISTRLIDTGGLTKGDRITHRFAITSLKQIDDEVKNWLKIAYLLDE